MEVKDFREKIQDFYLKNKDLIQENKHCLIEFEFFEKMIFDFIEEEKLFDVLSQYKTILTIDNSDTLLKIAKMKENISAHTNITVVNINDKINIKNLESEKKFNLKCKNDIVSISIIKYLDNFMTSSKKLNDEDFKELFYRLYINRFLEIFSLKDGNVKLYKYLEKMGGYALLLFFKRSEEDIEKIQEKWNKRIRFRELREKMNFDKSKIKKDKI